MQLRQWLTISTALFAASLAVGSVRAQEVVLKVHHFMPPSATPQRLLLGPWCEKLARESSQRIKCQIYPAMQLGGTPAQLFDQVRDGVADIVWTVPTYQAGRFTKTEVFELPFMTRTAAGGSRALWEYIQANALDEFKGTKLILAHVHDGAVFHAVSRQVLKLEDLKGMKVRAPSRMGARMLSGLGAVPVPMPMPQVPEALAKGVVDGAMVPWEAVPGIKIHEVTRFHTEMAPGLPKLSNTFLVVAMNEARYNSLPADLKKVIDANSGAEASQWAGQVWDSVIELSRKFARDRGNKLTELSPAEYQRWEAAVEGVVQDWSREVAAKGGDGKKLLASAKALLVQYDK